MLRIELNASPTQSGRICVQVLAEGSERLVLIDGPQNVALAALIEYLRSLTLRRVGP